MTDWNSTLAWDDSGERHLAAYVATREGPAPRKALAAGDELTADAAFLLVSQGTAIVWTGDYHNARQLLQALMRRVDKHGRRTPAGETPAALFHGYRQAQALRAAMLCKLLVPVVEGSIPLRRAPDATSAIAEALGAIPVKAVLPLTDLLAFISAREWRKNGVTIPALGGLTIHPHYGVFPPTRQDYIDLVAAAPLPATDLAFDLGTGSGVLAAVLLHRGVARVVATDNAPRAIACASNNFERLGFAERAAIAPGALYPDGKAGLIVCNPPWLPAKAATALESAVYDTGGRMLAEFLADLPSHLLPGGEGWLILSDLAEHLGLRTRAELLEAISVAGLRIIDRLDAAPSSKAARDATDPLYFARSKEVVSLWRLASSP